MTRHVSLHFAKLADAVSAVFRGLVWETCSEGLTTSTGARLGNQWTSFTRKGLVSQRCGHVLVMIHCLPSSLHNRQYIASGVVSSGLIQRGKVNPRACPGRGEKGSSAR